MYLEIPSVAMFRQNIPSSAEAARIRSSRVLLLLRCICRQTLPRWMTLVQIHEMVFINPRFYPFHCHPPVIHNSGLHQQGPGEGVCSPGKTEMTHGLNILEIINLSTEPESGFSWELISFPLSWQFVVSRWPPTYPPRYSLGRLPMTICFW